MAPVIILVTIVSVTAIILVLVSVSTSRRRAPRGAVVGPRPRIAAEVIPPVLVLPVPVVMPGPVIHILYAGRQGLFEPWCLLLTVSGGFFFFARTLGAVSGRRLFDLASANAVLGHWGNRSW
jgi:hypothetical protein